MVTLGSAWHDTHRLLTYCWIFSSSEGKDWHRYPLRGDRPTGQVSRLLLSDMAWAFRRQGL